MAEILHARVESPAFSSDAVRLYELSGSEEISKLFEFELHVACTAPGGLPEDEIVGSPATLVFTKGDIEVRRIHGMISAVKDTLNAGTKHEAIVLSLVPRAFRLSLSETSEVFVGMSVPDIIRDKLGRAGLSEGADFELRLLAEYAPREFIVQYQESDLQFLSRLAEHLGVAFTFEHSSGRDVMVFSDDNSFYKPIDGDVIPFCARGERSGVYSLESTTRVLPSRYVVKDYNYRTPMVTLEADIPIGSGGTGQVVEYGAHFKTTEEAAHIARVRAEELGATRRVFQGESDVQGLRAGVRFSLDGHPKVDGELLVVEVRHYAKQEAFGAGGEGSQSYRNEFRAIPYESPFRPPRVTPKPKVHGSITGVVEAEGSGPYAEVDDVGRYHVRFMFDTSSAPSGKASRPMRMAQPHAGPNYGLHFPLRHGVEVVLTCINGDPDRPIITGAVPNPATPSTVISKNNTHNLIRTGGGSEIDIDDTTGSERIRLSTPFAESMFQLGAPGTQAPGSSLHTKLDASIDAGRDVTIKAGVKAAITAGNILTETSPFIDITGTEKLRMGSPVIEINGGASVDAGADKVKVVGRSSLTEEAPVIKITGSASVAIHAGASVFIHGASNVHVSSGAVAVEGGTVDISGSDVNIKGSTVSIKGGPIKLNT